MLLRRNDVAIKGTKVLLRSNEVAIKGTKVLLRRNEVAIKGTKVLLRSTESTLIIKRGEKTGFIHFYFKKLLKQY